MTLVRFKQEHGEFEEELARAIAQSLADDSTGSSDPPAPPAPPPQMVDTTPESTLLEANAEQVGRIIARYQADAALLEAVIAERQERLRQTKISIEAFSLALRRLTT